MILIMADPFPKLWILLISSFVHFREALAEIFDQCDLNRNGTLSREEFNLYNLRTSGEEVADEEWEVAEGE
jgi:Ca2+-binding EF-hand superfamily protein